MRAGSVTLAKCFACCSSAPGKILGRIPISTAGAASKAGAVMSPIGRSASPTRSFSISLRSRTTDPGGRCLRTARHVRPSPPEPPEQDLPQRAAMSADGRARREQPAATLRGGVLIKRDDACFAQLAIAVTPDLGSRWRTSMYKPLASDTRKGLAFGLSERNLVSANM